MSGESCEEECKPLIHFIVRDGKVESALPSQCELRYLWENIGPSLEESFAALMQGQHSESAIDESVIRQWAAQPK